MGEERQIERAGRRSDQERELLGWLKEFLAHLELAWQLLWDGRVPFTTKLVPLFSLLYLLSPVDLISDLIPGLGQVDDLVLILIGLRMFISLSPPDIVSEYRQISRNPDEDPWPDSDPEIIELDANVPSARESAPEPAKGIEKTSNKDV